MEWDARRYVGRLIYGAVHDLTYEETREVAELVAKRIGIAPILEGSVVYHLLAHDLTSAELEAVAAPPGWMSYLSPEVVDRFLGHPNRTEQLVAQLAVHLQGERHQEGADVLAADPLGGACLAAATQTKDTTSVLRVGKVLAEAKGAPEVFTTLVRDAGLGEKSPSLESRLLEVAEHARRVCTR